MRIGSLSSSNCHQRMTAEEIHGAVGSIPRSSRLWTLSNGKKHPPFQGAPIGWRRDVQSCFSARWMPDFPESAIDQEQIKSPAFQNAELQSERLRIFGVLGFVAIFIVVTAIRVF